MKKLLAGASLAAFLSAAVAIPLLAGPMQERGLAVPATGQPLLSETVEHAPAYLDTRASVAAESSGGASGVLMLVGFLSLIAGLLAHWSRDTSCRDERSVYRAEKEAA